MTITSATIVLLVHIGDGDAEQVTRTVACDDLNVIDGIGVLSKDGMIVGAYTMANVLGIEAVLSDDVAADAADET